MDEIFVDANIFLEIFLKDKKARACKNFLGGLEQRNISAVTNDFILYSCLLAVQSRNKGSEALRRVLIFFRSIGGLKIFRPSYDEVYKAFEISKRTRLDFDDSLVVSCMTSLGIKNLISFDKDFDKVKEIKRVEPP